MKTRLKRLPLNLRRVVVGCVLGLLLLVLVQTSSDAGMPAAAALNPFVQPLATMESSSTLEGSKLI